MSYELRTMSDLRLCVVSPLYHPSLGGLGKQAQLLTERLAEKGVNVFVIARRMKGMPPAAFSKEVKVYRAWSISPYTHTFEKVRPVNILISLTYSISTAFFLFSKRNDYNIVHSHGAGFPLFICLPLLKLLRKKVIAKVASSNQGIELGSLSGRYIGLGSLMTMVLKRADIIVATTVEIEEALKKDGFQAERIKRLPNFIDINLFSPASADEKEALKKRLGLGGQRIVTFSGRFIECKGVAFLLRAWKDISAKIQDVRLALLGDGLLFSEMKSLAQEMGISDSVFFYGHVSDIRDFLHATDVFVLPSLYEGMPNSLLEAMACGLPVVASRIGGVVDIVKNGENGIITEPGDANSLASGIGKLLADKNLADTLAFNAHKTIREAYSLDNIAMKYIEFYRELNG